MKELKSNNKGFSLVELIVVVLIMAIIAVALAPQVLKWVNNSRISADQNTMQQVISNFQTALSNEAAYGDAKANGANENKGQLALEITSTGAEWKFPSAGDAAIKDKLKDKFAEYAGTSFNSSGKTEDFKSKVANNTISIYVNQKGKVTGEQSNGGAGSIDD
ncbi:MAG: type II secretion system GspH family protein [Lachnospiraceae bacterium]|nr:type II secretion system GspH family protein [Lachnospiraceae bacterium]